MMETLKISIVTPSFDQAQFIEECLESVQSQGYARVEHIVTDGVSTDGTVELLKRYSREASHEHIRWASEPDQGQSDALNKGFRMATGDVVGWLNTDDRYRPGCFRAVVDAFEKNPDVDVLYGDYTWIDESGRVLKIRREIEFSQFVLSYHRVLYIPSTATFFSPANLRRGKFHRCTVRLCDGLRVLSETGRERVQIQAHIGFASRLSVAFEKQNWRMSREDACGARRDRGDLFQSAAQDKKRHIEKAGAFSATVCGRRASLFGKARPRLLSRANSCLCAKNGRRVCPMKRMIRKTLRKMGWELTAFGPNHPSGHGWCACCLRTA